MRQHYVIYVPGILDDKYHIQGLAVATWRLYGLRSHIHPMPWAGDEAYQAKKARLVARIDSYAAAGHTVSLVGASAGASAVINAYVQRKDIIQSLICIAGKINGPETVSAATYSRNPAFKTSMDELQRSLAQLNDRDRAKLLSLYSEGDTSVPHEATVIPGVEERTLPRLGHGKAIIYSLTVGAPIIISYLKRRAALL